MARNLLVAGAPVLLVLVVLAFHAEAGKPFPQAKRGGPSQASLNAQPRAGSFMPQPAPVQAGFSGQPQGKQGGQGFMGPPMGFMGPPQGGQGFMGPPQGGQGFMGPPPRRGDDHDGDHHGGWSGMNPFSTQNGAGQSVCANPWTSALLTEMMNYDTWQCSSRLAADGSVQQCVLTAPIPVGTVAPATITTGCGWTMPLFCDDNVNDIVSSLMPCTQPQTMPTTGTTTPVVAPTYTGYNLVAGVGYYKVHTELLTWDNAKAACIADGVLLGVDAHLAVPSTAAEYTAIFAQLNAAIPTNSGAYVGMTDTAKEGTFLTVNGQPICQLGLVQLAAAQPDNGGGSGVSENCMMLGWQQAAPLNDVACTTLLPFVCEITLPSRRTICRK